MQKTIKRNPICRCSRGYDCMSSESSGDFKGLFKTGLEGEAREWMMENRALDNHALLLKMCRPESKFLRRLKWVSGHWKLLWFDTLQCCARQNCVWIQILTFRNLTCSLTSYSVTVLTNVMLMILAQDSSWKWSVTVREAEIGYFNDDFFFSFFEIKHKNWQRVIKNLPWSKGPFLDLWPPVYEAVATPNWKPYFASRPSKP